MPPEASFQSRHFEALGTRCAVFGVGLNEDRLEWAESWVRAMGARLTRFSDDSEIGRLNQAAGGWCEISHELEQLLRASLHAFEVSRGLVNVAVLPSMLVIGYAKPLSEREPVATIFARGPLPDLPSVLSVGRGRARVETGSGLDLGGIAKGWMADRLVEMLGPNCVANIGGDLMARGRGPQGDGWPVALGEATVLLKDQGAATSSVRRRRWGDAHHLIDPRTGLPSASGLEEVSVVAESGVAAEVVAKTALLIGPEAAAAYCATHALAWFLSP